MSIYFSWLINGCYDWGRNRSTHKKIKKKHTQYEYCIRFGYCWNFCSFWVIILLIIHSVHTIKIDTIMVELFNHKLKIFIDDVIKKLVYVVYEKEKERKKEGKKVILNIAFCRLLVWYHAFWFCKKEAKIWFRNNNCKTYIYYGIFDVFSMYIWLRQFILVGFMGRCYHIVSFFLSI